MALDFEFCVLPLLFSPDAALVGALPIFIGKRRVAAGKWMTENAQSIRFNYF